jgi:hypothetical protein
VCVCVCVCVAGQATLQSAHYCCKRVLTDQQRFAVANACYICLFHAVHAMQDHQTCCEACRTASSSLRDMQQALQAVRMATRCLYLRLLLSDAAKTEFAAHAPAVAGFFSGDHEQSLAVPA